MMSNSQWFREIIPFSTTTANCSYKHTEGKIWHAIPQKRERFIPSNEFMKLELKIFNSLLKTNTIHVRVENQTGIVDVVPILIEQPVSNEDADSDASIVDPYCQPRLFDFQRWRFREWYYNGWSSFR